MIAFGYTALSGKYSAAAQASPELIPDTFIAENVIVDQMYLTNNTDEDPTEPVTSHTGWEYSTIFNAKFQGNLNAGNADFTASEIKTLRIKRADADGYNWMTIHEIPIDGEEDFSFSVVDYLARAKHEYKYAIVPVMNNNMEGGYMASTILSDFDGLWVCEKDRGYNGILDLKMSTTLNQVTSTVTTLGRRHPYVNKYGKSNYYSGSFETTFVYMSCINETINGKEYSKTSIDIDGGVDYREQVEEFLTDGMPKVIKHMDGRMWIAMVTDTITKDESDWYKLPLTTVNFVEVGRYNSQYDLYNAGLLDIVIEEEVVSDELLP